MKRKKVIAVGIAIVVLGMLATEVASAHGNAFPGARHGSFQGHFGARVGGHGHGRSSVSVGAVIGVPAGAYWAYPAPYYVYSYPPVVINQPPPVYIERSGADGAAQAPANYWLYCRDPQGYYPNVQQCPQGWQTVPAQTDSPPD